MGFDVVGAVIETGADTHQFKVGDTVFAMAPYSNFGTFAEFVAIYEQLGHTSPPSSPSRRSPAFRAPDICSASGATY
ncbi:hypothetical protein L915_00161, partial [Phytophthora nicotianae]